MSDKIKFIDEVKLDLDRLADLSQLLSEIVLETSDIERVNRYYSLSRTITEGLRILSNSVERHPKESSS
jgi:hypothetical protein